MSASMNKSPEQEVGNFYGISERSGGNHIKEI